MKSAVVLLLCCVSTGAMAQSNDPVLSSWIQNLTGETGYSGIASNVQKVQYSDNYVYVTCTCIPGYDIGPWQSNPNIPKNQNFLFQVPRKPQAAAGSPTATPLGHIGVWTNGVSIFNAKDARSYNNANVWHQNAIVVEGASFDDCLGHPNERGEYHHHLNPVCLYDSKDSSHHSPIIGYAFDGYPIYGAYGFANADGTGGITRIRSSYRTRSLTERTTLADGTSVSGTMAGPSVSTQYPLGYYVEDFEYIAGSGDLDENNGRFCVTPEYPTGTYAYFVTVDSTGTAAYPYTLGPNYHGVVNAVDIGPGSGHVTVSEAVLTYTTPSGAAGGMSSGPVLSVYPNPATRFVTLDYSSSSDHATEYTLFGASGVLISKARMSGPTSLIDVESLALGSYLVVVHTSSGNVYRTKLYKR